MKKHILSLILLCLCGAGSFAQPFCWSGGYDFIGDNREFSTRYGYPETILGSRLSVGFRYQIDSVQSINAGGSYLVEHGEKMFAHQPVLDVYYRYKTHWLDFQLGSFPIETADFPKIAYTDSLLYYRPNYQGARGILYHKHGHQTLLFDWYTQVNAGYCEKFVTGFSGITQFGSVFLTDMFYYRHHAEGERGSKSVADNGIFGLNLGFDAKNTWFDSLSVSTGFALTWYANGRDTTIVSPMRSKGSYSTLFVKKKFIGVDALFYYGEGTHLPLGDPLFRCGKYGRFDAILYVLNQKHVEASFRFCTHYLDGVWDTSQQIYLRARIGGSFKKR